MLGQSFTAENPDRVHSRVQRWRVGWQRELNPRTAIDIAYAGSYADRQGIALRLDYLPEQYWSSANVRDTSANDYLTQNVPNPFHISNFEALRTSNPLLYQRMAGSTFFTSTTTQRHRLLRAFPHMSAGNNGLQLQDQPLGVIKSHALEIVLTRRYANGLSANAALTVNRVTENRTVHEFDREPTLWQTNNNGAALAIDRRRRLRFAVRTGETIPGQRRMGSPRSRAGGRSAPPTSTSPARC